MKRTKRMISVILLLCMVLTMLPPMGEVEAAGGRYRYELVTAAVDKNATYLVVSTNAVGEANCLMFDASGSFQNQKVTIAQEAVNMMHRFSKLMRERPQQEPEQVQPEDPVETVPSPQQQAEANLLFARQLLETVRKWIQNQKGGELK